jgi:hypothetical protein
MIPPVTFTCPGSSLQHDTVSTSADSSRNKDFFMIAVLLVDNKDNK